MQVSDSVASSIRAKAYSLQVLDAGTKALSDHEVLAFVKTQLATYETEPKNFLRPENHRRALLRHRDHLQDRCSDDAEHKAGDDYMFRLMDALEPSVQLTKTELLMLVNHRPTKRELLLPLIEDVETRYSDDQQQLIVDNVAHVLGSANDGEDADATMADH